MSLFRINIFLYDYSIAITLHMTKKNFQFMIYFHDKIYICLIRTNILSHKTQLQYTEDLMVFRIAENQGNTGYLRGHTGHTKSYKVILLARSYKRSYNSHTFWKFNEKVILSFNIFSILHNFFDLYNFLNT